MFLLFGFWEELGEESKGWREVRWREQAQLRAGIAPQQSRHLHPHLLRDPLIPEAQSLLLQILLCGKNTLVFARGKKGLMEWLANFFRQEPDSKYQYFRICGPHLVYSVFGNNHLQNVKAIQSSRAVQREAVLPVCQPLGAK